MFAIMLGRMATMIAIERNEGAPCAWVFDPAFAGLLTEAEQAFADLGGAVDAVLAQPVLRPEDRPLRYMAFAVATAVSLEHDNEVQRLRARIADHADLFACRGATDAACLTRMMIAAAQDQIRDLLGLALFGGDDPHPMRDVTPPMDPPAV